MKKRLLMIVGAATFALAACQTNQDMTTKAPVVKDGEVKAVKVKPISSFLIEVSPRKALCDSINGGQIECLQYRNRYENNFNPLKTDIEGFTFEPGYSYILDVRQEVMQDADSGQLQTKWILNQIISKSVAPMAN
ncbi:DUF4377 domain-containing protein [Alkanindiges sp. WGS2144]|uniref:DUF4377 domain-containing protein n=1 Tax=Alkanindiges sp. WGS2144 TaxID=3366808 RepID=UPI0037521F6B